MATIPVTTPWELTADYLMLTRRVGPPGAATTYTTPHPVGNSATDITTFVYGQAAITIDNWPEIMYVLEPDQAWKDFQKSGLPEAKKDQNQRPIMERFPRAGRLARPLLDFPVLPDNISSTEDWWWFDLWRRVDPRIRWEDITMRMEQPQRTKESDMKLQNAMQTMAGRKWHAKYFMLSWFPKGGSRNAQSQTHVLNALAAANIPRHLNTTRGLTPGLVDPLQPAGRKIAHPVMTGTRRVPRANTRPTRKIVAVESDEEEGDVKTQESAVSEVKDNYYQTNDRGEPEDEDGEGDEYEEEEDSTVEQSTAAPSPFTRATIDMGKRRRRSPSATTPSRPRKIQRAQRHPSVSQAAQKVEDPNNIRYYGATFHHHHYHYSSPGPIRRPDVHSHYGNIMHHSHGTQASEPNPPPEPSWFNGIDNSRAGTGTVNPRDLNPFH